jgi:hypothetical protein
MASVFMHVHLASAGTGGQILFMFGMKKFIIDWCPVDMNIRVAEMRDPPPPIHTNAMF